MFKQVQVCTAAGPGLLLSEIDIKEEIRGNNETEDEASC